MLREGTPDRRLTLLPHRLLSECESLNPPVTRLSSASDRRRARRLPHGSFRYRRTVVGIASCCARHLECRGASRGTAPLPATRQFAKAATRAIAPRDWGR